jgi:hypothetical protein
MALIFSESFETDGNGSRYVTSLAEFSDGEADFFTRTDGSNIDASYIVTDVDGNFFFAAQDLDGEGPPSQRDLLVSGIDITGAINLNFKALFAEDDASDSNEDWDDFDFLIVEYQIDGGGFQSVFAIAEIDDGDSFNQEPGIDTDFDGVADGSAITSAFTEYGGAIATTGSSLDLRFTFDLDAGDEDIAIDNIQITGDVPPFFAIAPTNATKPEGDSGTTAFSFTVTRSGDTSVATSVDYAVSSAEADASDFGGVFPSGTVNFLAGETTQTIDIAVSGNAEIEADEAFTVTLSNAFGDAIIRTASADGTIQNDDSDTGQNGNNTQNDDLNDDSQDEPLSFGVPLSNIDFSTDNPGTNLKGTTQGDRLRGTPQSDLIRGGGGNDRIISGFKADSFGNDRLLGGRGNDILSSGKGRDYLNGGQGNDKLNGGKNGDLLIGGQGGDRLVGKAGNDILIGGKGRDLIRGGSGIDMIVYTRPDEGNDMIRGFNVDQDLIDLRGIFANHAFSTIDPFKQFETYISLVQVGTHTELQIDKDGDGSGTDKVVLALLNGINAAAMSSANFVVN